MTGEYDVIIIGGARPESTQPVFALPLAGQRS